MTSLLRLDAISRGSPQIARLRRRYKRGNGLIPAVLGKGDGNDPYFGAGNNRIWVRRDGAVADDDSNIAQGLPEKVFCGASNYYAYDGARCYLETDPNGQWQVSQVDNQDAEAAGKHIGQLNNGNPTNKWFRLKHATRLKCLPVGTSANPSTLVGVRGNTYIDNYGDFNRFTATGTAVNKLDLAAYIPGANLQAVVAVWLDTVNGTLSATSSTAQSTATDLDETDYQEAFDGQVAESIPLQAFHLSDAQTSIDIRDLGEDLRTFINTPQALGFPDNITKDRIIRENQIQTIYDKLTIAPGGKLTIKGKLSILKNSPTITKTSIDAERINSDLDNTQTQVFEEDGVNLITAVGGITPDRTKYRIAGNGSAVTVTASPPITLGIGGQYLILEGEDDTDTVTLTNAATLHLHGGSWVGGATDILVLMYCELFDRWKEVSRNNTTTEKAWNFASPAGSSGTFYEAGFYDFGASNNDFSPSINWGTANAPYGAHFFVVTGAGTVDELTIRVTGTSITDAGVRTASDTDDIVIPVSTAANSYYEAKKFIGQVAISIVSGTTVQCNYGWVKYYDRNNTDFRITGLEALFTGGANDANANLTLLHHKQTGWTYNVGSTPTPPTAIADMQTDYVTEYQIKDGENGGWKRSNLNTIVEGSTSEGIIIQVDTTSNKTFEPGLNTFMVSLVPR